MSESDLERAIEQDHEALRAFVRGNPEPKKMGYSRGDDATLANPIAPPARGWDQIAVGLDRAASLLRDGEVAFERISDYATADLAYIVEIERARAKMGGGDDMLPIALRVTTIFRREDDGWKVVHRHADPITTPRPVESIVER
jgi:ketosteroid isomerase-like protein